jgi:hypothetical protein
MTNDTATSQSRLQINSLIFHSPPTNPETNALLEPAFLPDLLPFIPALTFKRNQRRPVPPRRYSRFSSNRLNSGKVWHFQIARPSITKTEIKNRLETRISERKSSSKLCLRYTEPRDEPIDLDVAHSYASGESSLTRNDVKEKDKETLGIQTEVAASPRLFSIFSIIN